MPTNVNAMHACIKNIVSIYHSVKYQYIYDKNRYKYTYFITKSVMIAQWNSSLSVLPVARVRFPATAEYFKGFFPGWSHTHRVTFSIGHAGASRKSPNDAPWETRSLRLSRPISAPLLTVARSWRHEKKSPGHPPETRVTRSKAKCTCYPPLL